MAKAKNKMNKKDEQAIEKMSFEEAYGELEATVQKLEAGNLSLEAILELYQRGMALAKFCGQQLDEAELSIKALAPSGELVDFDEA